ncbi:MAG: cation:proton antiporter [Thermoplasmata archaeon]|nr:cation:proton antiporter [Thermoplasmata archaeon]
MISISLILYIGIALALGFFLGKTTHLLRLTAIVGYIIAGLILAPILHILTESMLDTNVIEIIVNATLGLVGFIIGIGLTKGFLKRYGKMAIGIAFLQSTVTFALVGLGVYIITKNLSLSLILGAIGLATAPAGTVAAIHACRGRGKLSRMTIAVVGIDDGIAILYFVFILAIVRVIMGGELTFNEVVSLPLIEIGGAIIIGLVFGGALALMGKYIRHREDIFVLSISFILLSIGISELIEASSILACMILGLVFVNMKPRIGKTVHRNIESILPPIFVLFFAIAGLELYLQFDHLAEFGIISTSFVILIYMIYRILGKLIGANFAGRVMKAPKSIQNYLGFAILSQAGVAIGLAILVSRELSTLSGGLNLGAIVITIITLSTVFFEILGPISVKYALSRAGEAH